jgi:NTE family protein
LGDITEDSGMTINPAGARPYRIALVLAGGNALGAYHAGVYEALDEADIEPDWIVGTSIGAVNGAIIAGNPRADRLARLRRFWHPADACAGWPTPWDMMPETLRRTSAALGTMIMGRRGIFAPIGPLGSWWTADPASGSPALFNSQMLRDTLTTLIDFEQLNAGGPRFTALAVDIENGEEVDFDTDRMALTADHIRASAALLMAFPAIEIEGRLFGDGGLSVNLGLDPVMADADAGPTLCIAADLLPLMGARPQTLGAVLSRMQDLTFAAQSRRSIAHWQARLSPACDRTEPSSVTLVRLAYTDQEAEVAGKAMDFSPQSVRHRWQCGLEDGRAIIRRLAQGAIRTGEAGLTVYDG